MEGHAENRRRRRRGGRGGRLVVGRGREKLHRRGTDAEEQQREARTSSPAREGVNEGADQPRVACVDDGGHGVHADERRKGAGEAQDVGDGDAGARAPWKRQTDRQNFGHTNYWCIDGATVYGSQGPALSPHSRRPQPGSAEGERRIGGGLLRTHDAPARRTLIEQGVCRVDVCAFFLCPSNLLGEPPRTSLNLVAAPWSHDRVNAKSNKSQRV